MRVKFAMIFNDLSDDELCRIMDGTSLRDFQEAGIEISRIDLSGLVGIYKFPSCLAGWVEYDKTVIICNSGTAVQFLDVHTAIDNAELWILRWPVRLGSTDNPDRHKLFDTMPQMIRAAKKLMAS